MNDALKTLMVEQLEKYWFSDKRIHLNAIFYYQGREGNLHLVFEILGNREVFHSVVLWASFVTIGKSLEFGWMLTLLWLDKLLQITESWSLSWCRCSALPSCKVLLPLPLLHARLGLTDLPWRRAESLHGVAPPDWVLHPALLVPLATLCEKWCKFTFASACGWIHMQKGQSEHKPRACPAWLVFLCVNQLILWVVALWVITELGLGVNPPLHYI